MSDSKTIDVPLHSNAIVCDKRMPLVVKDVRSFERFLQQHGWSRKAAKSIASRGFKAADDSSSEKAIHDDDAETIELLEALSERLKSKLDSDTERR